jgi:GNAT superfamily N-acetyltransferase
MPISIRPADPADAPVIVEFNRLLALETEGKVLDIATLSRGVAACLADPMKGLYYLAETKGEAIGQIGLTYEFSDWRDGWFWWIQSVYVAKEFRRQGVFRRLYDHVHQAARSDATAVGLRLYVERSNHIAKQTYLRLGMRESEYELLDHWPLEA